MVHTVHSCAVLFVLACLLLQLEAFPGSFDEVPLYGDSAKKDDGYIPLEMTKDRYGAVPASKSFDHYAPISKHESQYKSEPVVKQDDHYGAADFGKVEDHYGQLASAIEYEPSVSDKSYGPSAISSVSQYDPAPVSDVTYGRPIEKFVDTYETPVKYAPAKEATSYGASHTPSHDDYGRSKKRKHTNGYGSSISKKQYSMIKGILGENAESKLVDFLFGDVYKNSPKQQKVSKVVDVDSDDLWGVKKYDLSSDDDIETLKLLGLTDEELAWLLSDDDDDDDYYDDEDDYYDDADEANYVIEVEAPEKGKSAKKADGYYGKKSDKTVKVSKSKKKDGYYSKSSKHRASSKKAKSYAPAPAIKESHKKKYGGFHSKRKPHHEKELHRAIKEKEKHAESHKYRPRKHKEGRPRRRWSDKEKWEKKRHRPSGPHHARHERPEAARHYAESYGSAGHHAARPEASEHHYQPATAHHSARPEATDHHYQPAAAHHRARPEATEHHYHAPAAAHESHRRNKRPTREHRDHETRYA